MCILIKKEKGRRRGHFNWTSTFSHLLDIESIGFLREGRRPFMVQVASRLYMFLKHVLRPFLNKVITWVGIGTMFLILTFFKKVAPLLFISDHFFASPCFMMCISLHWPQSSLLTTLNHPCFPCAIIFHFVLLALRQPWGSWSGSTFVRSSGCIGAVADIVVPSHVLLGRQQN
jgi:hypothetical protein